MNCLHSKTTCLRKSLKQLLTQIIEDFEPLFTICPMVI